MSTPHIEIGAEGTFEQFDDLESYNKALHKTIKRAQEIMDMQERGMTKEEEKALRLELPVLVRTLRHLLATQLNKNGVIAKMDMADGSYDNASMDNKIRQQLGVLRNLNTNMSRMIGTKTVRKISGAITEDMPNWFGVKWRQFKDNTKHFLKTTAVVGGLTAAGLLGGYALYHGGLVAGTTVLSNHLSTVGGYLATGASMGMSALTALKKRIFG